MTLHRFIHLGDLHLGPNSRNGDRRAALDQAIAQEILQPVAAWLFPGDLNHGRMTIEDRNWLKERVKRMADHAPVVICYGNHDLPGDLDIFADLNTIWPIYVVSRPQVIHVPLTTGATAAIFVLPYPNRNALVAAGTPSDQITDAARLALEAIFLAAAGELRLAEAAGEIPLMIGHVNVAGSIMSAGQPNIGKEIELDPGLLDRLGPIYKGLNHIHVGQEIACAWYAGSMCRLDWSEVHEKRYLVVECSQSHTHHRGCYDDPGPAHGRPFTVCGESDAWGYRVESKPLDVAPMYHVEGNLTREGFWWRIKGCDCGETWCGHDSDAICESADRSWECCEVRVTYRFNADEKSALDESLIRIPFEGAKRIELEPIAVRNRAIRAPEVAAAQTLDQKVAAFVRGSGVTWAPSLEAKLAALQDPDGAAFLTQIQQSLSEPRQGAVANAPELPVQAAEQPAGSDRKRTVQVLDLNQVYPLSEVEL